MHLFCLPGDAACLGKAVAAWLLNRVAFLGFISQSNASALEPSFAWFMDEKQVLAALALTLQARKP